MHQIHHLQGVSQSLSDFVAHANCWQKFSFYTGWQHVGLVKGIGKEHPKMAKLPQLMKEAQFKFPVDKRDNYTNLYKGDQKISKIKATLEENKTALKSATEQLNCVVRRICQLVQAILFCLFKSTFNPSVDFKELMNKFSLSTTWRHGDLCISGELSRFNKIGGFDHLALTGGLHITVQGKKNHGTEMALWGDNHLLYAKFDSVVVDELAVAVDIAKEIMRKENISFVSLLSQDPFTIQALKKAGFKNSDNSKIWSNLKLKSDLEYLNGYQSKYFSLQDVGVYKSLRVIAETGMDISFKPSGVTIQVGDDKLCLGRHDPSRIDLSIPEKAWYLRPVLFQIAAEILKADETAVEIRYWPTSPTSAKEAYLSGFRYQLDEFNQGMKLDNFPTVSAEMVFKKSDLSVWEKIMTENPILKNPGSLLPV